MCIIIKQIVCGKCNLLHMLEKGYGATFHPFLKVGFNCSQDTVYSCLAITKIILANIHPCLVYIVIRSLLKIACEIDNFHALLPDLHNCHWILS